MRAMTPAPRGETEALRAELSVLRAEKDRLVEHRGRMEAELVHLVRMRAASMRLSEARHLEPLREALVEVVVNLVGSERMGLYEPERGELVLRRSVGLDAGREGRVRLDTGPVAESVRTGVAWFEGLACPPPVSAEAGPRACVPLEFGGRVLGVILLFELLPHKPCLDAGDRELLQLLATEGARALYCARGLAAGWPS